MAYQVLCPLLLHIHMVLELKQKFFCCGLIHCKQDKNMVNIFIFSGAGPFSPTPGQIGGSVKLSVSYRNSTLFIMVMHIKDLVSDYKYWWL